MRWLLTACVALIACDGSPAAPARDIGAADASDAPNLGDLDRDRLQILAREQSAPEALAVAGDVVLWLNGGAAGSVMRVGREGGGAERIADAAFPTALAADDAELFWGDQAGLWWAGLNDGVPELLEPDADVTALALTSEAVFWADHEGHALYRRPRPAGNPERLAEGVAEYPSALAVDGRFLFWINRLAGELLRLTLASGEIVLMAGWTGDNTTALAADDTHLFWPNAASVDVLTIAKLGGDAEVIGGVALRELAVDAAHVYLTAPGEGAVRRLPRTGGFLETLVTGIEPWDVVATPEGIYWTDRGAGTVAVLPRSSGTP